MQSSEAPKASGAAETQAADASGVERHAPSCACGCVPPVPSLHEMARLRVQYRARMEEQRNVGGFTGEEQEKPVRADDEAAAAAEAAARPQLQSMHVVNLRTVQEIIFSPKALPPGTLVSVIGQLTAFDTSKGKASISAEGACLPVSTACLSSASVSALSTASLRRKNDTGREAAWSAAPRVCFKGRVKKLKRRTFLEATELLISTRISTSNNTPP